MPNRYQSTLATLRLALAMVYSSGRSQFLVIVVSTFVTAVTVAGQLLIGRSILDLLVDQARVDAGELAPWLAALAGLLLVSALSQALAGELRLYLSEQVQRRSMDDVLDVATEVDLETYEGPAFHDRMERARYAAAGQSSAVVFGLVTIMSTLLVAGGVVVVLLMVAPVLVPVAVVGYLPIAMVNVRNNRARYEMEYRQTELLRDKSYLEYVMTERLEAKEVRAYGIAPTLRTWHTGLWQTRLDQLRDLVRRRIALTMVGSTVTTAALIVTLSVAVILAGRGTISIGDAAVAVAGLQALNGRLQATGVAFSGVHEGITFFRDFERFRATLPAIRRERPTGVPPSPPTALTVDGLGYRYPAANRDALRTASFELRRGDIMAIVGANGSGKSTLAKLLCDLLPPTRGAIRWDGVDLAGCDPALVRAEIAPVFQDYTRYNLSIRQMVGLGDPSRLDDEQGIRRAVETAGVAEVVDAHPDGLDVRIGKQFAGGVDVSIGQWQRLAIARALFRDAPVVIMDEPSASLDPRAEFDLFELLQRICDDRIVIFISHRFATVRSADVVMVLDQGEVVELGPHDELMAQGGLYADLFTLQAERYGLASGDAPRRDSAPR